MILITDDDDSPEDDRFSIGLHNGLILSVVAWLLILIPFFLVITR